MTPILITAFLEGLSVLVVEIAGARALAPFFGTSLHVWTAQITATLLFLALGYGSGGILSRRGPRVLSYVFWSAGGWLALYPLWRTALLGSLTGLGIPFGAFVASAWLFGPPLTCMGAVSPLLIKRLGDAGVDGGRAAGSLFLTNTLGGLAGGWLTALVLIPNLSLRYVLAGTGAALVAIGAAWSFRQGVSMQVWVLLVVASLSANFAPRPTRVIGKNDEFGAEVVVLERVQTSTGLVQVLEAPGVWRSLLIDGVAQGAIDIPTGASYYPFSDYLSFMTHRYHPRARRVLLLGLGCGVLAKTLHGMGLDVTVAEIEPEVVRAARKHFALPGAVHVAEEDGRAFLARDPGQYDVVILDAFAGENSPWYLVTREGLEAVKAHLAPGGRMLVNSVTVASGESDGLKRLEAGLTRVFGEAVVYIEPRLPTEMNELVNATLVAGTGLTASNEPYPALPSQRVMPFLGDLNALEPRKARSTATVDTDDHSALDVIDAPLRLKLREKVIASLGPEILQD